MSGAALRLVYFGSGEFGIPTLTRLAREHEVVAIVTQPDRPAGRSQRETPTPVALWAKHHLPGGTMLKPQNVNDPRVTEEIRAIRASVFVVIAFGQKLGRTLLADRFAINLHASLLPRWRGAAPINHAVLAGDAETGNSVITLAETMDAGLILGQSRRAIEPSTTAGDLHGLLAGDGPDLVLSVLESHTLGTLRSIAQDVSRVTLAPKLRKSDGWVNFADSADACRRRINGLSPWPGVTVRLRDEVLRLLRAKPAQADSPKPRPGSLPGALIDPHRGMVACGGSAALEIAEVQPAGGRSMAWAEFARGRHVNADETLVGGRSC